MNEFAKDKISALIYDQKKLEAKINKLQDHLDNGEIHHQAIEYNEARLTEMRQRYRDLDKKIAQLWE